MKRAATVIAGACAVLALTGTAQAGNALYAARIGAVDAPAVAKFYESAFGMHEVLRRGSEIMLNFGDTMAAAKANKAAVIIIIHRNTDDVKDPVGHLILTVADYAATAAAVKAAGGTVTKPRKIAKTGDTIGFAVDPAGNRVELIQPPKE